MLILGVNSLSGEPFNGVALAQAHDRSGKIFTSVSLPIDASYRITAKFEAEIWANEFINFGHLIAVTPSEDKFNLSVNTSKDSPVKNVKKNM